MASMFLFFVPLTLLSVSGPFIIRVLTQSTQSIGRQVGRLSAVSTLGSVIGTLLIGYVLIPFIPNSITLLVCAGVLFGIVLIYFAIWNRDFKTITKICITGIIAMIAGVLVAQKDSISGHRGMKELARRNSHFGLMQVLESEDGKRYYLNDLLTQNIYDSKTKQSLTVFTYMLSDLAMAYGKKLDKLLIIGLGVGIVPRQFAEQGAEVDVVEINDRVGILGKTFFDFDPEQVRIHIGDGRHYLGTNDATYDAILLDAFLGDSSPSHLMTQECFHAMQSRLHHDGILVINSFGSFRAGEDFFVSSLFKTLQSVFKSVKVHDGGRGNVFFVASNRASLKADRHYDFSHVHPLIRSHAEMAYKNLVDINSQRGMILRDDYNPVEFYDAAVREGIRKNLALWMKNP